MRNPARRTPPKTVRDPRPPEMVFPTNNGAPEGRTFRSVNAPADGSLLTVTADNLAVASLRTGTRALPIRSAAGLYLCADGQQRTHICKNDRADCGKVARPDERAGRGLR